MYLNPELLSSVFRRSLPPPFQLPPLTFAAHASSLKAVLVQRQGARRASYSTPRMLSFFRRTPQASEAAPPPSKQARERKESAWLQSISSKSTKESSAGTTTLSSSNTPRKGSGTAPHLAHAALKPATASLRPQASSASLKCSATRHSFFRNPLRGREGREGATAQQEEERPGSSYAASAPAQHLHHPPRHHSPPPPLPKPAPPASHTDTSTKSLATRLQELSVANADGLLDDEEYRLLRTRLFETFATGAGGGDQESKSLLVEGREAVPRLGGGSIGASTSSESPAGSQSVLQHC